MNSVIGNRTKTSASNTPEEESKLPQRSASMVDERPVLKSRAERAMTTIKEGFDEEDDGEENMNIINFQNLFKI